ncbi:protein kinase [Nocardia xishanensis]|uniref:protein kinase domain-containing protein n=1 Tax=Nocardia xishanensis TaxID=238964 RepID=UPI003407C42B
MTEQESFRAVDIQPGYCVGDSDNPDEYRLEASVGGGGEGAVWSATTYRRNGEKFRWAVKILNAEHLEAGHNESAADALERWYLRARGSLHETGQVRREVPGVEGAIDVFRGARPHPPGEPGDVRTLYVVSPWIDGVDLTKWLKRNPTFAQVCDVAAKLAAIVDGIADSRAELVHRDISPANVMIDPESGKVSLIDFTFAVPTRSGPVTAIENKGYTAPEARNGHGSAAADRYSFGGVVFFLLTGRRPEPAAAQSESYAQLVRASFPAEVAAHVAALLSASPADRPTSLRRWASELAELGARTPTGLRYTDLDLTVDGYRTTTITALGNSGLSRARLGPGALPALAPDSEGPLSPVVVRSTTDGRGGTVDFVIDKSERIMFGRNGCWQDAGRAAAGAGLAVVRSATGSVMAFVIDPAHDRLSTIDVDDDGTIRRTTAGPYARRVLAATIDHTGTPLVATVTAGGELMIVAGEDCVHLGSAEVHSAAVCSNPFGEPVCFAATAGSRELAAYEQRYGQWLPTRTITAPGNVEEVACVGQRDGITLVAACADGLWVAAQPNGSRHDWQQLSDQHCQRVAVKVGAAWRLQLAAIADGQVFVATEGFGRWSTTPIA